MIKKIIIIIGFLFLILSLCIFHKKREINDTNDRECLFSLATNYSYQSNEDIMIRVFSNKKNSAIKYCDLNQFYITNKNEDKSMVLNEVSVSATQVKYNDDDFFLYKIVGDLPKIDGDLIISDCYIKISNPNSTVKIKIGSLEVLDLKSKNLGTFTNFYGTYAIVDNIKNLIGINLTLNIKEEDSYLSNMYINKQCFINCNEISCNQLDSYSDQIIESNYIKEDNNSKYHLKRGVNTLYIPINYKKTQLNTSIILSYMINNVQYYLSKMSLIGEIVDISNYDSIVMEGESFNDKL